MHGIVCSHFASWHVGCFAPSVYRVHAVCRVCVFTQCVMVCACECGGGGDCGEHRVRCAYVCQVRRFQATLGYVLMPLRPPGENRQAEYLAKNPQGTVPALELPDGRVIAATKS